MPASKIHRKNNPSVLTEVNMASCSISCVVLASVYVAANIVLAATSKAEGKTLLGSGWWGQVITVDNSTSHCNWEGLICKYDEETLTSLHLCKYPLRTELGKLNSSSLPNLEILNLHCNLYGSIPYELIYF